MTTTRSMTRNILLNLIMLAVAANAQAASTDISNTPLVVSSTGTSSLTVQPNVFLMMDDSGSMGWDYMPDSVNSFSGAYGYTSSQCNGVYYDPHFTYAPPVDSTGASYAASSFTAAKTDGYNTGSGTTDLSAGFSSGGSGTGAAFYYSYSGTQTSEAQRNYYNTNSIFYHECNTPTNTTLSSSFTVGGTGSTSVSSIKVNGAEILTAPTAASTATGTVASNIAAGINACTTAISGACQVKGYSASVSGSTVTINAPSASAIGFAPVVTKSGSMTMTPPAFPGTVVSSITLGGPANTAWLASHAYGVGDMYWTTSGGAAIWYVVNTAYTSGTTFGATDTAKASAQTSQASSILVNGSNILSAVTTGSNSSSTLAGQIVSNINACTAAIAGNCTVKGYSATASGSTITITAPNATAATFTPSANFVGPMIVTGSNPFTSGIEGLGVFTKVTVGATSGLGGTDERTNFANWYSYYRTRILMMKTATGLAFKPICPNTSPATACSYRVGMATMNNNGGNKFLNVATFDATQKDAFYTMLYSTSANSSTPLLRALTNAGQMYAYKLSGNALNGVTAQDPIQYSCQQNFTLLSTDGFWNDATNSKLTGGSVGQQDGTEIRPMYDGASQTSQSATVTLTDTQKQTDGPYTTTTPWTRTITTVGAACSTPAVMPSNRVSSLTDNSKTIALGLSTTNPNPSNTDRCHNLAADAWLCRGGSNPVSLSSATDSNGTTWYLVNSMSGNTGCTTDNSIWGSSYSTSKGACPSTPAVTGQSVTIQNQTYNQVVTGTNSSVDDYQTVTTTTVQTINGQAQPASTSTTGPTVTNVSTNNTVASNSGAPNGTTSWTTSSTTGPTCMATPPAAGTSTPVAGSASTTNGTQTVTVVSGPTTTQPANYNGLPNPNVTVSASGGTSNTLADVAEYYYVTDLRTSALGNNLSSASGTVNGTDVSTNNVPSSNLDKQSQQHMTTFTLGLGARGRMVYSPSYETDSSGDFFSVKNGIQANTTNGTCSWQGSGTTCNWPIPNSSGTPENIDDLWHAAVNGRGTYFAATNPGTLAQGISTALSGVSARTGSSAAATTSNPNVTSGDNFVFSSTFVTKSWIGELVRQQLDLTTGATLSAIDWAAQALLDTNATRTIYTYSSSASNHLQAFTATNFGTDANFREPHISTLSQLCTSGVTCLPVWQANHAYLAGDEYRVTTAGVTVWYHVNTAYASGAVFGATDTANSAVVTGAAGASLVNYLRGDRSNEGILTDTTKYFRQRLHILGDIVNAEAVYVKTPLQGYSDYGYTDYKNTTAARQGMVYAAANDGMLHAFYSASNMMDTSGNIVSTGGTNVVGGDEAWAYIPSMVLPNLYRLADKNYESNHQYYVDGTPISADICVSNCTLATATAADWRTILVGGLNAGGNGYYAMDVTNPAAPKVLWQFTDQNMGLTFGNPEIAKLKDGTWVVIVTSGYNNVPPPQSAWAASHVYVSGDQYYRGSSVYTVTTAYTSGATFGTADTSNTTTQPVTSGDGQGHLYVLDAKTGTLLHDIGTGVGDTGSPSGLGRIIAQVVNPGSDATVINVYGGDMLGNLWRFNIDPWLPSHAYHVGDGYWNGSTWYKVTTAYTSGTSFGSSDIANATSGTSITSGVYGAQLLATLQGPSSNAQPITTKPQAGIVSGKTMVYIGTGRYLGTSDLSDKSPQTIYGIMDPLSTGATPSTAIYSNPRSVAGFIQQTLTTTTCPAGSPTTICSTGQIVRTATHNTVNFASDKGWYVDLLDTSVTPQNVGERANNDPTLKLGTLGFTTNVPSASSCTVGGTSFTYFFDYRTGAPVSTSTTSVIGALLGNALATRPVYVRLPNNTIVQLIRLSDGTTLTTNVPIGSGASGTRRVSWRTLDGQ